MTDFELHQTIMKLLSSGNLSFIPSQNRLSLPIIRRIFSKMKAELLFPNIKVHGNLIIDGHHRYVASQIIGLEIEKTPTLRSSTKIEFDWSEVQVVNEDWDSPDDVLRHNTDDATYNGLTLEALLKKLD